ncbi:MAG: exosome complex RNA-binding protein Csl4, partial [Candidatus Diapherotrites archaeon]|nr:exosome complex RNA-binding protein Csl4 [Candidatus Diapherotrites archaeon]
MSEFVIPGELLATSEELELVKGSYQHDNEFRSLFTGELEVDGKTRIGKVTDGPERIFSVGPRSIVRGMVSNVMDNVAVIKVFEVEGKTRSFLYSGDAILLVSMASRDFVDTLKALFKIGDIVRLKVNA